MLQINDLDDQAHTNFSVEKSKPGGRPHLDQSNSSFVSLKSFVVEIILVPADIFGMPIAAATV